MPVTVPDLLGFKRDGWRFVMLTAYDYPTASILDSVRNSLFTPSAALGFRAGRRPPLRLCSSRPCSCKRQAPAAWCSRRCPPPWRNT
jgi:hypothetical protein